MLKLRANGRNNSQQCRDLQCIVEGYKTLKDHVAPTMLEELCKRTQHCCANVYANIIGDELLLNFGAKFQR